MNISYNIKKQRAVCSSEHSFSSDFLFRLIYSRGWFCVSTGHCTLCYIKDRSSPTRDALLIIYLCVLSAAVRRGQRFTLNSLCLDQLTPIHPNNLRAQARCSQPADDSRSLCKHDRTRGYSAVLDAKLFYPEAWRTRLYCEHVLPYAWTSCVR